MSSQARTVKVGLFFNRARGYGRGFCEGVASWAGVREDWQFEMLEGLHDRDRLKRLDGLIAHIMDDKASATVAGLGIPVVADYYRTGQSGFAQALPDHAAIGKLAAEHFRARGFSHFAFCGYDGILFSDARRDGFVAELARQRCEVITYKAPDCLYRDFNARVILHEALTPKAPDAEDLQRWLATLPTPCALFCPHDLRAIQATSAAKAAHLHVPQDLAVLGVDNDTLVCTFATPRLSSVDNNAFGCGRAAAELLDALMRGEARAGEVRRIAPRGVVERQSTETLDYPSPLVNKAIDFMRRHLTENLTAAQVFDRTGTTHTHLDALFKAQVGTTVHGELKRLRLAEAKRLLAADSLPLTDIAKKSGFASARYFAQVFMQAEHVSPAGWRARVQGTDVPA